MVFDWPKKSGEALFVQSTKSGLRFDVRELNSSLNESDPAIEYGADVIKLDVILHTEYQEFLGFGGAFTDAAGLNIQSLSKDLKQTLLESYFGENGSQYNLGRVVISGADFSTRPYSYDDVPPGSNDFNLTHWKLKFEDYHYKIPLIKDANEIVGRDNRSLKLFGSSWSPPAFMKTSRSLVRGHLINEAQVYTSYADYLVRFYLAYRKNGIEFWGGTVQNEPVASNSISYNFNSLQLSSEQAAKFIGNYLGPALEVKGFTKDNFKLMINDDNIDTLLDQAPEIMADRKVQKYVSGLAFHWYNSGRVSYNVLNECYEKVKDHIQFMLSTEACIEPQGAKPVDLGSWERGERYAIDIIEVLRRHSVGWVDWNLALDEKGGPNWVRNFVDSPIIISDDKSKFYKQPMYYVLAHFSRFFRPGSVRIDTEPHSGGQASEQVLSVIALKKDTGHVVVNVLNKSTQTKTIVINILGLSKRVEIAGKSINTVVIKL